MKVSKFSVLFVTLVFVTCISCEKWPWQDCYKGKGDVFEKSWSIIDVKSLTIDIPIVLYLHSDTLLTQNKLVLLAQENVAKKILVSTLNNDVAIAFGECFSEHEELEFHLYFKSLDNLIINSPSKIFTEKAWFGDTINWVMNSSATIDAFVYADQFNVDLSGPSTVKVAGYSKIHAVKFNSSASYDASNLITDTTLIDMSSGASFKSFTAKLVDVKMTAGKVEVDGHKDLEIIKQISGGSFIDLRIH